MMEKLLICLLLLLPLSGSLGEDTGPRRLQFAFLTSLTGRRTTAETVPAVELALRNINEDPTLLPGYELEYSKRLDSGCDRTTSLDAFFEEVPPDPTDIAVIGCGCSDATEAVAEIAHYWNIPLVSYASSSAMLSTDQKRFRSYFQMHPSDANFIPAFIAVIRHWGWNRVSVITEEDTTLLQIEAAVTAELNSRNISMIEPIQFNGRLNSSKLEELSESDVRIIFLNAHPMNARKIMCEAYRMGLHFPHYVWIVNNWHGDAWKEAHSSTIETEQCTDEQVARFLYGAIVVQLHPTVEDVNTPTTSGITAQEFKQEIENLEPHKYTPIAALAYDAVWALALALNSTLNMVQRGDIGRANCSGLPGQPVPLHEFSYSNALMGCLIQHNLENTEFLGVSGHVEFDSSGTRIQETTRILQYRGANAGEVCLERIQIAHVNISNSTAPMFQYEDGENDDSVFPGGVPPDGTPLKLINVQPLWLVIFYYILSTIGIAFSTVCLLFNVILRKKRIVRLTSPNLNYFIVVGAILLYGSIYFRIFPTDAEIYQHVRCNLMTILAAVGYCLCFAPALVKMWRVYYIFDNPSPNKKAIKDWHLTIAVMGIVGMSLLMVFLSVVVPDLRPDLILRPDEERPHGKTEDGITIVYCAWECYNKAPPFIWLALEFVYLAILQLAALGLAFKTRKVKIKVLNDSKSVGAIIYITSIILVALAVIAFALESNVVVTEILFSGGILLGTSMFLALTFVPKMVHLYRDPEGQRVFEKTNPAASSADLETGLFGTSSTLKRTEDRDIIATLSVRVKELESRLSIHKAKALQAETGAQGVSDEAVSTEDGKMNTAASDHEGQQES